ncbi:MAG: glycosyltransferase family 1 protein, partial [Lachnospiraceae bacterium]|nr:glycosyltransferase family 1 protein [Lachnospiraceae bacterium]
RLGGGFSIIEAFSKGKPGVYLNRGDVYTAGGSDFAVCNFDEMLNQILKYKDDRDYYNYMSVIARKRAELMTSSKEAITDIDRQICQKIEENYW